MVRRKKIVNVVDLEALDRIIVSELKLLLPKDIKSNLFIPVFKPNYKVLFAKNNREIRLYPPCKRTIVINGKQYYLPFPNIIFQRKYTPPGNYSNWNKKAKTDGYTNLFVGFTIESAEKIYNIPFGGVANFCACLDQIYHFDYPGNSTFEDLIKAFWATSFNGSLENFRKYRHMTIFGGRFHAWSKLSTEQIEKDLPKLQKLNGYCYDLKQFEEVENINI
jgi:hypothetical protein